MGSEPPDRGAAAPAQTRRWPGWSVWLLAALVAAACAGAQLASTWRRWGDVQVDFGRELYVPWRLAQGASLYRDVFYLNGPLSPVVNEGAFRILGTSVCTLVALNLLVLALACVALALLFRRTGTPVAALLAPLTLLAVFAFQHVTFYGNYNWLTPYSHEMTHGVTLSLLLLLVLSGRRAAVSTGRWWLAGCLLGLVFLTKPEIFLAALAGALTLGSLRPGPAGRVASLGRLAAGALAPLLLAWGLLAASIGAGPGLRGVLGAWPGILSGRVSELTFYSRGMGLDQPGANLVVMLKWSAVALGVLGPLLVVERAVRSAGLRTLAGGVVGAAVLAAMLATDVPWGQVPRPLPLLLALALGWSLWSWRRAPAGGEARETWAVRAGVLAFSLVLLLKIVLNARLHHYGFVLAMPALACVMVCLAGWLPAALAGSRPRSPGPALAALGLLAGTALGLSQASADQVRAKTWPVGAGGDRMFAEPLRGRLFQAALAELEQRFPVDASMVVLPEDIGLNYWSRRVNPTPHTNFMPPEFFLYGEDSMVEAMRQAKPDVVLLVHKDTYEYGPRLFGRDYGQKLHRWVRDHYESEHVIGHPPLQRPDRYGVEILRRRD